MRVYRVSPILQYSPFYKLTYFSKLDFEVGNICEIDFNKRKIKAIVCEVLEMNDAKIEIRKGNFTTKKIEERKEESEEKKLNKKQFELINEFADKYLVSVGEVYFALTNKKFIEKFKLNEIDKKNKNENKEIVIEDFDLEKYIQYQAPHINQIDLLILYLKVFEVKATLVFKSNFIGVSEKLFLENLKDFKIRIEEGDNEEVKKYIYKLPDNKSNKSRNDDSVNSDNILDKDILDILKKEKSFVFVLGHGYAHSIYCNDCGSGYKCDNCDSNSNYSILNEEENVGSEDGEVTQNKRYLFCKNCEHKKVLKEDQYLICKKCGGWGLFPFGAGGQKIYEELLNNEFGKFTKEGIVFIDESEKKLSDKKLEQRVLEFLESKDQKILLGTKKVLKMLKEVNAKLQSFVVSLGVVSGGKNFDSDERFIKLLSEVEGASSKMYVGKKEKENNVFEKFKNKNRFVEEEISLRKLFDLPPYSKIISFCFNKSGKRVIDKYLVSENLLRIGEKYKGNNIIYHLKVSEKDLRERRLFFESLRQFGELVVSDYMYENFINKKR